MVKMTDDTLRRPYKIAPGMRVRLESAYDGNVRRLGVMVCRAINSVITSVIGAVCGA